MNVSKDMACPKNIEAIREDFSEGQQQYGKLDHLLFKWIANMLRMELLLLDNRNVPRMDILLNSKNMLRK